MPTINLAGIQSIDIPPSIFSEFEARRNFGAAKYPEMPDIKVDIVWDKENKFQSREKALVCKLDNCVIGYIPTIATTRKYVEEAARYGRKSREENDLAAWEKWVDNWKKHTQRLLIIEEMRGFIETELFINHVPVDGYLTRVQYDERDGRVLSVSVGVDIQ